MKKNTKNLILVALITSLALVAFVIEASIPPLTPIYGIKLGIANVFTLFALYYLGKKEAAAVTVLRIILGSIFAGQAVSFIYSMCGGILSLLLMILLKKYFTVNKLWALSGLCAVVHNFGQIMAAVFMTGTIQVMVYFPILVISGIIAGVFTGLCAQFALMHLKKQNNNHF
ncbi:MAG: Gx transporter family protein [Oscillospiraceae bacterium]|nr:Gx transporter family protein [Oscillospiraceae bacterium]